MSGRWTVSFHVVLLSLLSVGCVLDGPTDAPVISNRTGAPVQIFWDPPVGDGSPYTSINSGQDHLIVQYPTTCMPGLLVAKDAGGRVIARLAEPLCPRDEWVIDGSPEPS